MNSFAPFIRHNNNLKSGLILLADHATANIPETYQNLGLEPSALKRHIAYDIGIEMVTRHLANLLDAPCLMANFSRLLIDPNRSTDDPTLIRQIYDGQIIPNNVNITAQERAHRINAFYQPYHDAIEDVIRDVRIASGAPPLVVSLHSFTPQLKDGFMRPWQIGLLYDSDLRVTQNLQLYLEDQANLTIGLNEPYDGALEGDTMYRHCSAAGLAHSLIELRQDLIIDEKGAEKWAGILAPAIIAANKMPENHTTKFHGSRVGPIKHEIAL